MKILQDINNIALKMRDRLLDFYPNPIGQCYSTSMALAIVLSKKYIVKVVQGYLGCQGDMIHFWVEVILSQKKTIIVDLTADQFEADEVDRESPLPGVIVGSYSTWKTHHKTKVSLNHGEILDIANLIS